jgi:hypothetical protein
MLAGWAVGAVLLYGLSTLLMGGAWVTEWWRQASSFRDSNVAANGVNFVSFPGFVENLAGVGSPLVWLVGYGVAGAGGVTVAYYWWKHPKTNSLARFALAAAAVVVAAPQTLYYDAGLLLLGLVAILPLVTDRFRWIIGAAALASWAQVAAGSFGWSPLAPVVWVAAGLFVAIMAFHEPGRIMERGSPGT